MRRSSARAPCRPRRARFACRRWPSVIAFLEKLGQSPSFVEPDRLGRLGQSVDSEHMRVAGFARFDRKLVTEANKVFGVRDDHFAHQCHPPSSSLMVLKARTISARSSTSF